MDRLEQLRDEIRRFVDEREWAAFHGPKNLVMALSGEVGELTELFQWLSPDESDAIIADLDSAEAVRDELADVLYYLIRLADVLEVDLVESTQIKLAKNAARYPVDASRGVATKYTKLAGGSRWHSSLSSLAPGRLRGRTTRPRLHGLWR